MKRFSNGRPNCQGILQILISPKRCLGCGGIVVDGGMAEGLFGTC